ncbi:FkbM family methyltransferase [Dactylosporangium aurantiacum]|uniref:FkbM family methyltransferase n=1 Tax=Dactylosporangium aurantiacum TaxID=35754 RepID=A0A9Q9I9T6_9ACTN|nr:FkbM family methyltransferase [Dactylosporangium aurantiacum]MDG6106873.1 FkbM family methyltransferase [Dactylosporangium aurantiacum]UWZ51006.1 FkbM family methyltransferase [Dactylosporangium aurantiacum]
MTAAPPEPQRVALPDGRLVAVTNPQDVLVWPSLNEDSPYADGIAGLRAGDIVVDVGAHIGLTALHFTDQVPGVRVLAFEPARRTHACLADNAARLMPGVRVFAAALGAEPGTAELTFLPNHTMMATIVSDDADDERNMAAVLDNFGVDDDTREQFWREFREGAERYPVPVRTLADVLDTEGVTDVGLLKIDVERGELPVLRGLRAEQWTGIRRVVAEVHAVDGNLDAVVELLHAQGFSTKVFQEDVFAGGSVHIVSAVRPGA